MVYTNKKSKSGKSNKSKSGKSGKSSKSSGVSIFTVPVGIPRGCGFSKYIDDPSRLGRKIVVGCGCTDDSTCSSMRVMKSSSGVDSIQEDGYKLDAKMARQNCLENIKFYKSKGIHLEIATGVYGLVDSNSLDIHSIYGTMTLAKKHGDSRLSEQASRALRQNAPGVVDGHYWLQDVHGNIYDHVDPSVYEQCDAIGCDVTRIQPCQRFEKVSARDMFSKYGIWYFESEVTLSRESCLFPGMGLTDICGETGSMDATMDTLENMGLSVAPNCQVWG